MGIIDFIFGPVIMDRIIFIEPLYGGLIATRRHGDVLLGREGWIVHTESGQEYKIPDKLAEKRNLQRGQRIVYRERLPGARYSGVYLWQ